MKRTLLLFLFFLPAIPQLVHAAGTGADPVAFVRSILDDVMAIQTNPALEGPAHQGERKKSVEEVISRSFDIDRMAQTSLADYWPKLDRQQRLEFVSVFRALFQDSYTRMVLNFLKAEKIRYLPATEVGKEPLVKTVIERPNESIPVEYRLAREKAGWRIHDVSIDDVSIVETYRSSFNQVIRTNSFQSLLEKLRLQQKAVQASP